MEVGFSLAGKWALVTGASRGIGAATARRLAEQGANVAVHYHSQRAAAEATLAQVEAAGRVGLLLQADLSEPQELSAMMAEFRTTSARLDILVLAAAATAFKSVEDIRPHHLAKTYNLVLGSLVQLVQEALPMMGRDGRLVAVSGQGTEFTLPRYALLGSAKGAVEVFVRYLAQELGPRGITANSVSPGVIDTDSARFYAGEGYPAFVQSVADSTAVGRIGTAEDVAAAIGFLVSPEAAYITGQVLVVDGGLALASPPFMRPGTQVPQA